MGKSIGLYGGTFDPIHFGHLNLAIEILEIRGLDEVWFCPAFVNPHKMMEQPTSAGHRLNMLRLAIEDEPRFVILDTEIKRQSPSFTIDTIQEVLATQAGKKDPNQFSLIIGEDALPGFFSWKQPEEILRLLPVWVGSRSTKTRKLLKGDPKLIKSLKKGITRTRGMEISGTDVRRRLQKGLYCSHLVPAKVLDYISSHGLYCVV